jgi:transcriptional regulator with XRE-family HTH domain
MSGMPSRATTSAVADSGRGVAFDFWERINREMHAQEMTQTQLVERSHIPASTINNLRTSTRAPASRIVNALADALGIDREEAAVLAGRLPAPPDEQASAREIFLRGIRRDPRLTDSDRQTLRDVYDALTARNEQRPVHPPADGRSDDAQRAG